jgi:BASS family bile acid:Na+ symporter
MLFVISSMLAMGLGLTVSEILTPLRSLRLVILSLVANFLLMPLVAFGLARLLRLDAAFTQGLLLLGSAAGAPFLPRLAQLAKANLAFAVGLMVLLMVITVGFMPLVLPILMPGVSVAPGKIARSLVLLMLIPLFVALIVRAQAPRLAARAKPPLERISTIALVVLVALLCIINFKSVVSVFGTRAILAGIVFIAAGYLIGWPLGGPGKDTRLVLGLGTAQRNIAAAIVVANQSFEDPGVMVMVVVVAVVSLLGLLPFSRALGTKSPEVIPG